MPNMIGNNDPNETVVVELNVDQFGPFDHPQWTSGMFVVSRAKANALARHFAALAAAYDMKVSSEFRDDQSPPRLYKHNLVIRICEILPIPLELYDHFIHEFVHNDSRRYVVGWKYKGAYGVFDGAMNVGFGSLAELEQAARLNLIPVYANIGDARLVARKLDNQHKFSWEVEGMIK